MSDLRKFFKRHAKTNQIDALTLGEMPFVDPDCLLPLEVAKGRAAALHRRVRACERLVRQIGRQKTRIRELARQMMPCVDEAMDTAFRDAQRVVLEHYANPHRLPTVCEAHLAARIQRETRRGSAYAQRKAAAWVGVARSAVDLYGDDPAVAFEDLADEIATEITLLKTLSAELTRHEAAPEQAYLSVDERQIARSLPGVGIIGGPTLVAAMRRPSRFPRAARFRRFTVLTPKASETEESDAKGEAMSNTGARWSSKERITTRRSAWWPLTSPDGAWVTLLRQEPYVLGDLDGRPITIAEGKVIVAEHFKVSEEARRRRRMKKKGGRSLKCSRHERRHAQVEMRNEATFPTVKLHRRVRHRQGPLSPALDKGLLRRVSHVRIVPGAPNRGAEETVCLPRFSR